METHGVVRDDTLAHGEILDALSKSCDNTDDFMAGNQGKLSFAQLLPIAQYINQDRLIRTRAMNSPSWMWTSVWDVD